MRILLAGIVAAGLLSTSAEAGAVGEAAAQAEKLAAQGKFQEALDSLATAQDMIWQQAPLSFRKTLFVASEPAGFGIYDLRESNEFKRNERLLIYAEPVGYGYGRDGQLYTIDLALDFTIKSPDGKVVASQVNFATLSLRSRVANKEFMAKVTYDFSGLEPGAYEVITRATDKNSGKSAEFSMPFKLTP